MPSNTLRHILLLTSLGSAVILTQNVQGQEYQLEIQAPPPKQPHIRYSADVFEYERSTPSILHLRGNVQVQESTWTIRAKEIRMDLDSRRAYAPGRVVMDDGFSAVTGDSGEFDFQSSLGRLSYPHAEYPPWRIWAREGFLDAERRSRFYKARFTSCNVDEPHYHFRASSVYIRPHKWLYANNAVFYLGRFPIFYSPFLWKSLRPRPFLHTRIVPGYDRRHGVTLRTTTLFDISPTLYGKIFLDHYGKQRPGYGAEIQYHVSQEARGALYGYRIRERSGRERWTALGELYQTLSPKYMVQARLQAQSDTDFNNDYQRANSFRVTSELVNNAALVRRTSLTTTRLSYGRVDVQDPRASQLPLDHPDRTRYVRTVESWPRVDFQTAQFESKYVPVLYTAKLFFDNLIVRGQDFRQRLVGGTVEATQRFRLAKGLVFTPRTAFSELYENRRDVARSFGPPRTLRDSLTGRYELGGNLRLDTFVGNWDLTHSFIRRFKANTFQDDAGALDHGIESHALTLQDTLRPNRQTLLRIKTGYNLQQFRNRQLKVEDRFQPFVVDLNLTPRRKFQISLRDEYHLKDGNRSFLFQTDWGDRLGSYVGVGVFHALDRRFPHQSYIASSEFGWAPSSATWRIDGALRYHAKTPGGLGRLNTLVVFEKELAITKIFHDFYAKVVFRTRPIDVYEVFFRIHMRIGKEKENKILRRDWESEWFPWRRDGERE